MGYEVKADETETCLACERGQYKDNEGDSKFLSCKECINSTTDMKAATSEDQCKFGKFILTVFTVSIGTDRTVLIRITSMRPF